MLTCSHQKTLKFPTGMAGFLLVAATFFVILPATLGAAEIKPPLQALRHPNYTLISAEPRSEDAPEGKLAVRIFERLKGDVTVPEDIELLVNPGDIHVLEPGRRYLIFYTDVERVSFKPRTEVRRPDRRRVLYIDGAGPAVFLDSPEMRSLFDPAHAEVEQSPQYREIVLEGLHSESPAMVDLWSAEWALRPATFARIEVGETERLREIVEDPGQRAFARSRILLAAPGRTPASAGDDQPPWYVHSAIRVLEASEPSRLPSETGLSQLIYACLQVIRDHPDEWHASLLEKWLRSTPPLAENAAIALRAIDPEVEREAVSAAIADPGTPATTRSYLEGYYRRLTRVEPNPSA